MSKYNTKKSKTVKQQLRKAINEFKKSIPKTQDLLFDQCYVISEEFARFLDYKYRITCKVVKLNMLEGEINYETCHEEWATYCGNEKIVEHAAVLVNDIWIVDFTAKQFNNNARVPEVYKNFEGRVNRVVIEY